MCVCVCDLHYLSHYLCVGYRVCVCVCVCMWEGWGEQNDEIVLTLRVHHPSRTLTDLHYTKESMEI